MKYQSIYNCTNKLIINLFFTFSFFGLTNYAQSVTNGDFSSSSTGWGCNPETNPESTYGGSGSNRVGEVDASAGLCQTITGLTVGSVYHITFDCSRRTTCGPATQTLDFSIDGGALAPQNVSRSGAFGYTPETFTFTAQNTSHTIDFNGTSVGTCGLIIDNVAISILSALPIALLNFEVYLANNKTVQLIWQTASETNNDFFSVERSTNALDWEETSRIQGAGNASSLNNYATMDDNPFSGTSFYRLKQTDFNGDFEYSKIRSVKINNIDNVTIYPNPSHTVFTISGDEIELSELSIYNTLGQNVTELIDKHTISENKCSIDLSKVNKGIYYLKTKTFSHTIFYE